MSKLRYDYCMRMIRAQPLYIVKPYKHIHWGWKSNQLKKNVAKESIRPI